MSSEIRLLGTGIDALDKLLGGGIPSRQMLLLAGQPGSGKTILGSQIAFAQAARGVPVILATAASEPHTKMLESLQGFSFFERERVGQEIFLLSVYPWLRRGVKEAREMILSTVRERRARLLVVDGLRSLRDVWQDEASIRDFLAEVGVGLATHDCTGVLTFECAPDKILDMSEAATVDGVVNLVFERDGVHRTRSLEVVKIRGRRHVPGEHRATIDSRGFNVSVRLEVDTPPLAPPLRAERTPFGLRGLDAWLGGGVSGGGVTLLKGPAGAGKSLLGAAFARGAARDGGALLVSLEESEVALRARTAAAGLELGQVQVLGVDRLNLDPDAVVREVARRAGSQTDRILRLVVDGVDLLLEAVAPERARDFVIAMDRTLRAPGRDVLWTADEGSAFVGPLTRTCDTVLDLELGGRSGAPGRTVRALKLRGGSAPVEEWAFNPHQRGWAELAGGSTAR